jgi:plastocyanin
VNTPARRSPARVAVCAAIAAAAFLTARPGGAAPRLAGRIEGRVVISIPVAAAPPSAAYGSRRISPAPAPASELSNVIVFLKNGPRPAALAPMRASILQQNETFIPRTVAITTGSRVDFPNGDPFFHDVFSLSRTGAFDLGSYPKGQSKSEVFKRPGLVKVYCHLHSHMTASIMVFDHPYFAIPSTSGAFAIDNVPPGTYTVSAWHERIGENTQQVTVEDGRTAELQFSLPISAR